MPDRDVVARLPQIALHQLAGSIDRPLKRPRRHEPGADLADIVIKDRPPARIPQLGRELPQPLRLDRRISCQLLTDPAPKRIQLRPIRDREYSGGCAAGNARRMVFRCNPVRRLISRIESCSTRASRLISADCSTPTTPASSSPIATDHTRLRTQPDNPDPTPGGPLFSVRH
jgi:hypothetical protein